MNDYSTILQSVYDYIKVNCLNFPCVTTAAVLMDVLHAIGVKEAYALTVYGWVYRPEATRRLGKDLSKWNRAKPVGQPGEITGVAIGGLSQAEPGKWPGHLVVIIPNGPDERDRFIDLSIEQANRPELGIMLRPVALVAPPRFVRVEGEIAYLVNDCGLIYEARPEDQSFENTPAWRDTAFRQAAKAYILASYKLESGGD